MKNFQIWKKDGAFEKAILIPCSEIEERANVPYETILIGGVDAEKVDEDELSKKFEIFKEKNGDDLEEFFLSLGYEVATKWLDAFPKPMNVLAYDQESASFYIPAHAETIPVYGYWDGSNWREIAADDTFTVTEVECSENKVSLDEWDGSNLSTDGRFSHEYVRKVYKIDGEIVKGMYLLVSYTDWQGSLPEGTILSREELIHHLEDLGRNVEEYMNDIDRLD